MTGARTLFSMPGRWTLGLYFGRIFLVTIGAILLATCALVFLLDLVEMLRRASDRSDAGLPVLALLSAARTPAVVERIAPFVVLFAALVAFLRLSRRNELVVARATGVSAWQFLTPAVIVGALFGIGMTVAFNPLAAHLQGYALDGEAQVFGTRSTGAQDRVRFIRQRSVDGQAIIRARGSSAMGRTLTGVTIFAFTPDGAFEERIEAARAVYQEGFWRLEQARILRLQQQPHDMESLLFATNLTADQVAEGFTPANAVAFWDLPGMIAQARNAGLSSLRFELQRQTLIARPMLFVAMILIAATVSLRFFRMGGIAPVILGGVGAGFMLYVLTKISEDLGAAGLVTPQAAAWLPAIIGAAMSITVLLYREDG